ncbi:FMN-dependent NADH-azoreductase [Mangrovitalea sediminis]|uniref:FMN-dependent NADH-azoreductase n=1 Tax=Mangrovitalea sediminis TaxID=1982043 RepID=UPI000BE5C5FC|nr:NAD(P)H-dependent oxidoreductase [Mangrovitalea sediminis]
MATLLQIKSSIFGDNGNSSKLADQFVQSYLRKNPGTKLVVRDLTTNPLPHLDGQRVGALFSQPESRTPEQQAILDESDALVEELRQAEAVVLGVPMYNFGVPSVLKAYFDHIARAGVTFRYTENGPEGLLEDRPVYILAARGGFYKDTPTDSQAPFLTTFLNFIGLKDLKFIYAEGLNVSEDNKREALAQAADHIERLSA